MALSVLGGYITTDKIKEVAATLNMTEVEAEVHLTYQEKHLLQTLIGSYGKKVSTQSKEYAWYTENRIPMTDATAAAATVTLPAAAGGDVAAIVLQVANPDYYEKHQVLYVNSAARGSDGGNIELFVQNISAAGIEVKITNAPASAAGATTLTIADGTPLIFAGVAKSELDWNANTKVIVPQRFSNCCQNFMGESFLSEHQIRSLTEVKWGLRDIRRQALLQFKTRKEMSYCLGSGYAIADSLDNNSKQTCMGLLNFDVQKFATPAAWNEDDFQLFMEQNFRSLASSDTKFLLAGSDFLRRLNVFVESRVERTRAAAATESVLDLEWNEIKVLGYRLLCKRYVLLDEVGKSSAALVIDPQHIGQASFIPLRVVDKELEVRNATGVNGVSVLVNEVSCPVVYVPQAHTVWNW